MHISKTVPSFLEDGKSFNANDVRIGNVESQLKGELLADAEHFASVIQDRYKHFEQCS